MLEALLARSSREVAFSPPAVVDGTPFKGWVADTDLISGAALASLIGLKTGTPINDKAGWLKFVDGTKTLYVARMPLRYGVTVADLKAAGQPAGVQLTIGGVAYKCRLMSSMQQDPITTIIDNPSGGEWNAYLYPIFSGNPRPSAEVWSYYTLADLGLLQQAALAGTKGVISICKEQHNTIGSALVARGWDYQGGTSLPVIARKTIINDASPAEGNGVGDLNVYGWRPVLEVVPDPLPADQFYGEVAEADFISAAAFTTLVGMDGVGSVTNASSNWLKYLYKGRTVYMAKKPLRHGMTWEAMDALGLTKGTKQFTINGQKYTVRLPTGSSSEQATYREVAQGGSFNDLIYPVYGGVGKNNSVIANYPRWAAYTDADLGLSTSKYSIPAGGTSWCQELTNNSAAHLVRGYNDSDESGTAQLLAGWYVALNATQAYAGWRPIIELVP